MGPWDEGFDDGFGPLLESGVISSALLYFLGFTKSKETPNMKTIIYNSSNSTGTLNPNALDGSAKNQGFEIRTIEMDVPLDEVGSTDPSITLSGAWTGSYTFHSSVSPNLRFKHNETVNVTTSLPTAEYSISVKYIRYDSDDMYTQEGTRKGMNFIPQSTWASSKVEPTGVL